MIREHPNTRENALLVSEMDRKKQLLIILVITSTFLLSNETNLNKVQASTIAAVYIDPPEINNLTIGDHFKINVTIANVSDLAAWEFQLYYHSHVLNATEWEEGPFLQNVRSTFSLVADWNNNYNTTHGRIWLACTLLGSGQGADGSGTLATITFQIKGSGYAVLSLPEKQTKLYDSTPVDPQPIAQITIGGSVYVKPIGIHDIAVLMVKTSKTILGKGYTLQINATAENQGNFTETFNLTVYCNMTAIETLSINLANGTSTVATFMWNNTNFAYGNYTIKAYAEPVPEETETADNTLIDGEIILSIPGDIEGDGDVDIYDVVRIASIYGVKKGDPRYNADLDVNYDEKIDLYDIVIAASHYGESL